MMGKTNLVVGIFFLLLTTLFVGLSVTSGKSAGAVIVAPLAFMSGLLFAQVWDEL